MRLGHPLGHGRRRAWRSCRTAGRRQLLPAPGRCLRSWPARARAGAPAALAPRARRDTEPPRDAKIAVALGQARTLGRAASDLPPRYRPDTGRSNRASPAGRSPTGRRAKDPPSCRFRPVERARPRAMAPAPPGRAEHGGDRLAVGRQAAFGQEPADCALAGGAIWQAGVVQVDQDNRRAGHPGLGAD